MVQLRTNELTYPSASNILLLLNAGVEQVSNALGGQRAETSITTTSGQITITLPEDVQDVTSANFSTGAETASGTIVYPLTQLEPQQFMDFAGGMPTTSFGPPTVYMIATDLSGTQTLRVYPAATAGQVNVYYRQRPQLWADTTTGSTTSLDPMAQEAVILWTCARVCEAREKTVLAQYYQQQYEAKIGELKDQIQRRTVPKSGQVRDVLTLGSPRRGLPPWGPW